jgi:geranylgeranyl pyrophosphate synthase
MAVGAQLQEDIHESTRLHDVMGADLEHVSQRVIEVTELSYPVASSIIREIVLAGGKRLRPLLVLLAGRGYDYHERFDELVTAAAGVELLHVASLVHDDTIDRAALRRGKPTLNSVMSAGATILVGDFLFAQSAMLAARTGDVRVVGVFASTLGELCDGQLLELFDSHKLDQQVGTYIRRIYGKTASLFAGAAEMGSVLAHAPEPHVQELRQFATEIGLAFQIQDDVLDLTRESDDLGKPAGNDLRQGTVTLPTLLFAQRADPVSDDWRMLERVVTDVEVADHDVADLIERIRASGAIDDAMATAHRYRDQALARLSIVPDSDARDLLTRWAHQALGAA